MISSSQSKKKYGTQIDKENGMQTLKVNLQKIDFERAMITLGMALMETTGVILLVCGLFDIHIV